MIRSIAGIGRCLPRLTIRRLTYFLFVAFIFTLFSLSKLSTKIPHAQSLSKSVGKFSPSKVGDSISKTALNPFRHPSHPPPHQKSDSYKGASWWSDWKWMSVPFSSSLTLDQNRVLLPPLKERPYIFCYYDSTIKKTRSEKDAESALLLTWRKAWWAQGFRPTILSAAEAVANPLYLELQQKQNASQELRTDLMRWMAWETMDGGLMSHYTLLPMAPWEDSLLTFLRRGDFPKLTSYADFESGLMVAPTKKINMVIRTVLKSSMDSNNNVLRAMPSGSFQEDNSQTALASYSLETLKNIYKEVSEELEKDRPKGLRSLQKLINAHLQISWQNGFPDGIEVLKPMPKHTTELVKDALRLAQALALCPESPLSSTCPPNNPKCSPCDSKERSAVVQLLEVYRNSTTVFTIGTVPHPWTFATATNLRETLDVAWIRRESKRDAWINAITADIFDQDVSSDTRVMHFKQAVAGDPDDANTLWLTAEADLPNDLDWHFGFALPSVSSPDEKPEEGPAEDKGEKDKEEENKEKSGDDSKDEEKEKEDKRSEPSKETKIQSSSAETDDAATADREVRLLQNAKKIVALTKSTPETKLRASLEAWNLADTEAWRFARAFLMRQSLERRKWEKEESKYVGGAGSEGGRSAWDRWRDRKD